MTKLLTRTEPPVRYPELARFLPMVADRARVLRVSVRLLNAVEAFSEYSRSALPAARVNLVAATLASLEKRLGDAEAAGQFLLVGDRASQLLRNGGGAHRARILAAAR